MLTLLNIHVRTSSLQNNFKRITKAILRFLLANTKQDMTSMNAASKERR